MGLPASGRTTSRPPPQSSCRGTTPVRQPPDRLGHQRQDYSTSTSLLSGLVGLAGLRRRKVQHVRQPDQLRARLQGRRRVHWRPLGVQKPYRRRCCWMPSLDAVRRRLSAGCDLIREWESSLDLLGRMKDVGCSGCIDGKAVSRLGTWAVIMLGRGELLGHR